ncbi:hypothetical protein CYY_009930 [Polysphondylium violaceum]|uniref:Transmembrane protein n=1 Tax=Polysphondylium violaceum TaxID=133409 RepID=A0A8J4PLG2_9MYCE|nr:hypothetical protein CYY_009930 [Polysphondylium violaceum]
MKLKIAIGLSVIVLACCIASFILPWYYLSKKETNLLPKQNVVFKWKYYQCQIGDKDKFDSINYDDIGICGFGTIGTFKMPDVAKILNTCLSFLVIGAAVALFTVLLQFVILLSPKLCRSCIWKVLSIAGSIATIVLLFISFFTLLGLPKAFKEDYILPCDDYWCDKVYGDDADYKWLPHAGWWTTLAACFFALCSGVMTLASSR